MIRNIEIKDHKIYIDGRARQIVSGAIHYFRSMPGKWNTLLKHAKGFGLDAVETYIAWDQHEPREGVYDFSGKNDLLHFIDLAQQHGLLVIVRPGPFICAEWNNGGLPPWLTTRDDCRIRRDDPVYLNAVEKWYKKLLPMLAEKQYTKNGPVICSVIENEYGSYGSDSIYLEKLRKMFVEAGFEIPLFTADGGMDQNFTYGGMIDDVPVSLTMGPDRCIEAFKVKDSIRPHDPDFCMEYWCGTFDHWGKPHRTLDQQAVLEQFDAMLGYGASVNFYMFHGGTNFGFFNGANTEFPDEQGRILQYSPTTTSYDYNAPLDESGEPTELFRKLHEILRKYRPEIPEYKCVPQKKNVPASTGFSGFAPLFDHVEEISNGHSCRFLQPMKDFGQYYGYQFCCCTVPGPFGTVFDASICGHRTGDRAQVYLDGNFAGDLSRNTPGVMLPVKLEKDSAELAVLAENQGYINFAPYSGEKEKGPGEVLLGGGCNHFLTNWEIFPLPMDDLSKLSFEPLRELPYGIPAFYRAEVDVEEVADTFLKYPGVKGFVMVNGFNIGRYWNIGPGDVLFVPGELLEKGRNEIVVFEQYQIGPELVFADRREWGETTVI